MLQPTTTTTTTKRRSPRLVAKETNEIILKIDEVKVIKRNKKKTILANEKVATISSTKRVKTIVQTSSSSLLSDETRLWKQGYRYVVGVDEAGRGPLAGPVVVAGCAIDENATDIDSSLINDSKKLTEEEREKAFEILTKSKFCHYKIAIIDHEKIDEINILKATLLGMDQVIVELMEENKCDAILIDGPHLPPNAKKNSDKCKIEAIKGGDAKVRAIGAASILAKVTRDRLMKEFDLLYPVYNFSKHKGYPVPGHVQALMEHGPCVIHRKTFKPVKIAAAALLEKKQKLEEKGRKKQTKE